MLVLAHIETEQRVVVLSVCRPDKMLIQEDARSERLTAVDREVDRRL